MTKFEKKDSENIDSTIEESVYMNPENKELNELHERIKVAASYLERLDTFAEYVSVDADSGEIKYAKPDLGVITDGEILSYQQNFTELLKKFKLENEKEVAKMKAIPEILDVKVVMGAVIVTLDSSKHTPPAFLFDDNSNIRAEYQGPASNIQESPRLGIVVVDICKEKRKDGVDPTVSTVHELHHHTLAMSDYLMSQDSELGMESSFRGGRVGTLYGEKSGRITTSQAFWNDVDIYEQLADRPITDEAGEQQIVSQLKYLNELHSSYLQKKPNWFSAKENVYASSKKGKHWEVVGDHPEDVEATKKLLGYLQGMFTLDQISSMWINSKKKGTKFGPGQEQFMSEFQKQYIRVGSLIGSARTVKQALELVKEEWGDIQKKYSRLLKSSTVTNMIDQWEGNGSGADNLRSLLTE